MSDPRSPDAAGGKEGTAYSQRHLDPAEAAAYREKHGRTWLRRLSHWREMRCVRAAVGRALAELPPSATGPTVLDLPCGAGRLTPWLAAQAARYLPADHSPHMVRASLRALADAGLAARGAGSLRSDARNLALATGSVDLAVCLRLVHHFPEARDRDAILAELARVSRGPVVVSYLDAAAWKQRRKRARADRTGRPGNRAAITRAELAAVAGSLGLVVAGEWRLSSLFSGLCIALLSRRGAARP